MGFTYTWHNNRGGTNCYKSAIMHARMLAQKQGKPILILYHGKQSLFPRNKTADPRRVSQYIKVNGETNFAMTPDSFYQEPTGAKGLTWNP